MAISGKIQMPINLTSVRAGIVVSGIHLHKDTIRFIKKHDHRDKVNEYAIEAKLRPLLVICKHSNKNGTSWYTVLPITSKGRYENGATKRDCQSIGDTIQKGRQSFVKLAPETVPDKFISNDGENCEMFTDLDPLTLQNIMRIVTFRRFGESNTNLRNQ
jgi:hypothetical protein